MSTTPESGAVPRPLTPNAMAELLSSRLRVARFRFDAPLSLKKNEVSVGCFEALIVAVQVCGLEARAAGEFARLPSVPPYFGCSDDVVGGSRLALKVAARVTEQLTSHPTRATTSQRCLGTWCPPM